VATAALVITAVLSLPLLEKAETATETTPPIIERTEMNDVTKLVEAHLA